LTPSYILSVSPPPLALSPISQVANPHDSPRHPPKSAQAPKATPPPSRCQVPSHSNSSSTWAPIGQESYPSQMAFGEWLLLAVVVGTKALGSLGVVVFVLVLFLFWVCSFTLVHVCLRWWYGVRKVLTPLLGMASDGGWAFRGAC